MRGVGGCTGAGAAATEITYTARAVEIRMGVRLDAFMSAKVMSAAVMSAEPEVVTGGFLCRGGKCFDGSTLFGAQLGRYGHVDGDEQVTDTAPVVDAPTLDAKRAARPRARRDANGDRLAVERGHLDIGAERGFGKRHRHLEREVVAFAAEEFVR